MSIRRNPSVDRRLSPVHIRFFFFLSFFLSFSGFTIPSSRQELMSRYRQLSPDGSECGCLKAIAVFKPGKYSKFIEIFPHLPSSTAIISFLFFLFYWFRNWRIERSSSCGADARPGPVHSGRLRPPSVCLLDNDTIGVLLGECNKIKKNGLNFLHSFVFIVIRGSWLVSAVCCSFCPVCVWFAPPPSSCSSSKTRWATWPSTAFWPTSTRATPAASPTNLEKLPLFLILP